MAQNFLVDYRDIQFTLFEALEIERMNRYPRYESFDRSVYEETLDLARKLAVEQLFPANTEGHKAGCVYDRESRSVTVPGGYKSAVKALIEAGFLTISDDPEIGGMGMPLTLQTACWDMFCGAGGALMLFFMLNHGSALMIRNHGTEEQKELYMPKLLSGEWGGTMCLTEPGAGSDVGALKTKALSQPDGTYRIVGQKCFITNGEQDITRQIIYPVLARIEGDPPGTKGISLFLVPKYLINDDGSLGERNDVYCAGIEEKMGGHGSPTCSMSFGENDACVGYLLGRRGRGMNIMFEMLNETRLEVGIMALGGSGAAYMQAVDYAHARIQGSHVTRMFEPDAPKVPIIQHPDVMRMLLWMKSTIEAERLLAYYVAQLIDLQHLLEGEEAREAKAMVEFLVPLVKAGITDTTWLVTSEAIQIHGGYGYCEEYPVAQFALDSKALTIVEGTNGIQSLDLVMRKLLMNPDQYSYGLFKARIAESIAQARGVVDDGQLDSVERGVVRLDEVVEHMKGLMASGKFMALLIDVDPLRRAFFDVVMAWMHLWSLTVVKPKLASLTGGLSGEGLRARLRDDREAAFYYGKAVCSEFWLSTEFPKFFGKIDAILNASPVDVEAGEAFFAGLYGLGEVSA
ncbi:MAG: acyl-CoA dehydrogenase [Deltaproteobacteria bacterium]|nr:acyl-CoA dehydrogenase [Deltaproteobacteria bacterium]